MRTIFIVGLALNAAQAQHATVSGTVVLRDYGQPLGYTTIAVLAQGRQLLATDSGTFLLRDLPAGEVRLRFKRIGFVPKDTAFTVATGDSARVRIEMTRLVISLPSVVVDGSCTDRTPLEAPPVNIAALFDQVRQNAERMRLLAQEKPFTIHTTFEQGLRDRDNDIIGARTVLTDSRPPMPTHPYAPGQVIRQGLLSGRPAQIVKLPELPDLADTAFTNNHCLSYAGQERFESDSVIRVDFEPVPRLAREVDIAGIIYLRVGDYQIVGLMMWLNRIPANNRVVRDYAVRARFRELVSGIPVVAEWTLTNTYHDNRPPFVQTGKVTGITWQTGDGQNKTPRS
ncbi:MAG: carboxypeptidase regulatory-like domain-containing protein [Gemmatimonadaceae bacterium]